MHLSCLVPDLAAHPLPQPHTHQEPRPYPGPGSSFSAPPGELAQPNTLIHLPPAQPRPFPGPFLPALTPFWTLPCSCSCPRCSPGQAWAVYSPLPLKGPTFLVYHTLPTPATGSGLAQHPPPGHHTLQLCQPARIPLRSLSLPIPLPASLPHDIVSSVLPNPGSSPYHSNHFLPPGSRIWKHVFFPKHHTS